jgi:hypothetical protein
VVVESTMLREGPDAKARAIGPLPQESIITLLGQVSGAWVRVQPADGVVPGWAYGPDLRPLNDNPTLDAELPGSTPTPGAGSADRIVATAAPATPTPAPHVVVTRLDPAPLAPPPALPTRQTLTLSVTLVIATAPPTPTPALGQVVPTPRAAPPLGGVRVQLITVFGDVLAEAVTPPSGTVRLTRDLDPGVAVFVRVPAASLQVPIDLSQPTVMLAIPSGGLP